LTIASDVALDVTKTFTPSTVIAGSGRSEERRAGKDTRTLSTPHNAHDTDAVNATLIVTAVHDNQGDTHCAASLGQNVDCTFATLAAGATATVTVTYHVDAATSATPVNDTGRDS